MSYPENIPSLYGQKAREFVVRFESFSLSKEQKDFLQGALALYHKLKPVK